MNNLGTVQGKAVTACSDPRYTLWISAYAAKGMLTASCQSACREMQKAYPELLLIRGSIHINAPCFNSWDCDIDGLEPGLSHFWLETADGLIVDPTAGQFTDPEGCYRATAITKYFPFDESKADKLPTSKCPNCGDYCYGGNDFCSDGCGKAYRAYIMSECRL